MHAVGGEARYVDPTGKAARPGNWNLARPCGDSSSPLFYDDRPMVIRPGRSFLVVWTLGATSERYVWHCSAEVGTRWQDGFVRLLTCTRGRGTWQLVGEHMHIQYLTSFFLTHLYLNSLGNTPSVRKYLSSKWIKEMYLKLKYI